MDADLLLRCCLLFCLPCTSLGSTKPKDETSDEIFDNILKERGLVPPHELFGKSHKAKDAGRGHESRPNDDDERMLQEKLVEISLLKEQLNECNAKKAKLLEDYITKTMTDSTSSLEMPYLKQIFRVFLSISNDEQTNASKMTFLVDENDKQILSRCLHDELDAQTCVDVLKKFLKTGHLVKPSQIMQHVFNYLEKIKLEVIIYILVGIAVIISCYYATKLILSRNTLMGMAVVLLIISFFLSIPWEWMRMYKQQLAAKAKNMKSTDCFSENLSYIGMLKYWAQDTFSFADSECTKYYDALMVDPLWEVSPGQAVAASFSRIFLQPSIHIAEHLGKFFRLIFKEVPVQWQPFIFIAIVVTFLFSIGIQIYTPLLRIGMGGDQNNGNAMAAQRDHIAALEDEVGRLQRALEHNQALPAAAQGQEREVPEIREQGNDGYVFVEANQNAVEDIMQNQNEQIRIKQPTENVDRLAIARGAESEN